MKSSMNEERINDVLNYIVDMGMVMSGTNSLSPRGLLNLPYMVSLRKVKPTSGPSVSV